MIMMGNALGPGDDDDDDNDDDDGKCNKTR